MHAGSGVSRSDPAETQGGLQKLPFQNATLLVIISAASIVIEIIGVMRFSVVYESGRQNLPIRRVLTVPFSFLIYENELVPPPYIRHKINAEREKIPDLQDRRLGKSGLQGIRIKKVVDFPLRRFHGNLIIYFFFPHFEFISGALHDDRPFRIPVIFDAARSLFPVEIETHVLSDSHSGEIIDAFGRG